MTFTPISLALRAIVGVWNIIKGAAKWASRPFERPLLIGCAIALASHWFIIEPRLRSDIETLQTRVDAEVAAHQKTKDEYRKAMLRAEEKARAAVEAEMERQDANDTIAINHYRAGIGDLDVRADSLREHFGRAAIGRSASGANLPAAMAHPTGAAQAGADHRLSGSSGGANSGETCPPQLMDAGVSMSIEERRIATEQARQLDAILTLDALNAGGAADE